MLFNYTIIVRKMLLKVIARLLSKVSNIMKIQKFIELNKHYIKNNLGLYGLDFAN